ncbi:hypothetical protein [Lysinibacillus piscis]|uniref:Glycosyl transferase family 2 n=1 Tax=Lysinibacillus piscis TaxID=2518931 RepID=A0ABQ5NHF4_9BACI|nr:hypothetical protein [Lysinibacillus sp. KH24]GLC87795.1 hypothetical protein LYSBPC_09220 [Lysinibacillus sp. KH24]
MKIIITMAGESSRFKKSGYKLPKYKLLCHNKTLFTWSLQSLEKWFTSAEFVFVLRQDEDFVQQQCHQLGIERYSCVKINHFTSGQAETALFALTTKDESIAIYNIDTYVKDLAAIEIEEGVDGMIPVFSAEGTHWSFTKSDAQNKVIEIAEKRRISEWATVGLYYFASSNDYKEYYNVTYSNLSSVEKYIAPIYETMIRSGKLIKDVKIPSQNVIPLGTPAEVTVFDKAFSEVNLNR